jgi:hypothetical protein
LCAFLASSSMARRASTPLRFGRRRACW